MMDFTEVDPHLFREGKRSFPKKLSIAMATAKQLSCQNKGCGKYFDQDSEDDCFFHPGGPVFHDALKGWSCCPKRVTDFEAFLKVTLSLPSFYIFIDRFLDVLLESIRLKL